MDIVWALLLGDAILEIGEGYGEGSRKVMERLWKGIEGEYRLSYLKASVSI